MSRRTTPAGRRVSEIAVRKLPSLAALHDELSATFPQPQDETAKAPKFLYRGEDGIYPKTAASLKRVDGSCGFDRGDVEDLFLKTREALTKLPLTESQMSDELAEGFLQHYGLPTDYIDFTASSKTAIQFAATQRSAQPMRRLAVLDRKSAKSRGQIEDLRKHPWAARPTRQYAFAFKPYSIYDLKDPAAAQFCQWFEFPAPEEDEVDASREPAACRRCRQPSLFVCLR